jgi:hypothetical protein
VVWNTSYLQDWWGIRVDCTKGNKSLCSTISRSVITRLGDKALKWCEIGERIDE